MMRPGSRRGQLWLHAAENAGTQRLFTFASRNGMALRHGAALPTRTGSDRPSNKETAPDPKLSPSEKGTLQKIAEGEYHLREFDWVALQHLKKLALAEDSALRRDHQGGPKRASLQ